MVNKILTEANAWLGYLEKASNASLYDKTANAGSANYTCFAVWYQTLTGENYQAQPWCAMFVSCVLARALGESTAKALMPMFAYCPTGVNSFKAGKGGGKWLTANPEAGDIIFFADSTGVACHVGIVSSVSASTVVTIEGNTSDGSAVVANGGAVCKKAYNRTYSRILGYGRPAYTSVSQETKEEETMTQEQFNAHYEAVNPKYTALSQVPAWYKSEAQELKDIGVLQGNGVNEISIRLEELQSAVIALRAAKAMLA